MEDDEIFDYEKYFAPKWPQYANQQPAAINPLTPSSGFASDNLPLTSGQQDTVSSTSNMEGAAAATSSPNPYLQTWTDGLPTYVPFSPAYSPDNADNGMDTSETPPDPRLVKELLVPGYDTPYSPGNDNEKDGEDREEGADEGHREAEAEADPSSNALAIAVASALADGVLNDDQVYAGVVGPSLNPTIAGPIYEALPVYSGYVQPAYDQAGCSHAGNPQVGYSQEGYGQAALFTPGNVAMDTGQAFPALSQTVQFPVFHQPQAYSGMKYMQPVYYWSGTST
ncbi:hypothetical protein RvY_19479, partial [Ramazzottius varieornatus]